MFSCFLADKEDISACNGILCGHSDVQTVTAWKSNIEIFSKDAWKGSALKKLDEKLNVELDDVISIGDGDNDRQMISISGLGLAVKNGCDTLKEIADKVICNNDGHVMQYVKEHYFV